jgi:hypothetical protein
MLAPEQLGDTIHFSAPEVWKNNNYSIQTISNLRNQLIYSRAQTHIKTAPSRLMNTIKELAMSNKSIASQVELQKPVIQEIQNDPHVPLIARTAPVETIEDWVQSKIEASWGGEWKSFRKDFPLTEKSLEDWRYLAVSKAFGKR